MSKEMEKSLVAFFRESRVFFFFFITTVFACDFTLFVRYL